MIIPDAKGYSIWLLFEFDHEREFQKLIDELSSKFHTPSFKPHITLVPGIEKDEAFLVEKLSEVIHYLNEFYVKCIDICYNNEFYRSLFVELEKSEDLINAFELVKKSFDLKIDVQNFTPHISLIYSHLDDITKIEICNQLKPKILENILINRLALYKTIGKPSEWKLIKSYDIRKRVF